MGIACLAALTLTGFGQQSSVGDQVICDVKAQWASEMKDPTNVADR